MRRPACAWTFDTVSWSHDRDFAGAGWPSWSGANLIGGVEAAKLDRRDPG